jgi:hypothetical protein
MKKILFLAFILGMLLFSLGCQIANPGLGELQVAACNTADNAGTCHTRLEEVGIVTPEDCCSALGKCC